VPGSEAAGSNAGARVCGFVRRLRRYTENLQRKDAKERKGRKGNPNGRSGRVEQNAGRLTAPVPVLLLRFVFCFAIFAIRFRFR
jgi:hypothetical protein